MKIIVYHRFQHLILEKEEKLGLLYYIFKYSSISEYSSFKCRILLQIAESMIM